MTDAQFFWIMMALCVIAGLLTRISWALVP